MWVSRRAKVYHSIHLLLSTTIHAILNDYLAIIDKNCNIKISFLMEGHTKFFPD